MRAPHFTIHSSARSGRRAHAAMAWRPRRSLCVAECARRRPCARFDLVQLVWTVEPDARSRSAHHSARPTAATLIKTSLRAHDQSGLAEGFWIRAPCRGRGPFLFHTSVHTTLPTHPGLHMRKYRPPYLPYSGPQIPETQKARISDGPGSDRIFGSIPPTDHLDLRQSVGGRGEASIDGRGSRLGGGVR